MPRLIQLYLILFLIRLLSPIVSASSRLPASEKNALEKLARELKWYGWNFLEDPCLRGPTWVDPNQRYSNNVTCVCTDTNGCHVVTIVIKSKNLSGTLPRDLSGLPELRTLDLARNYINGTIPPEWGSTKLQKISILGNRVTGSIPKEIGNMSSLREFVVEYNQLSGVLPPELGNLTNISHLFFTSNYFAGELPETLGKLTTLTDLRIGDNLFTGPIPEFLQNLTKLQRLYIHGTNLSGPIPRGIGLLSDMQDLKISDLVGGIKSEFPTLSNMKNLSTLNCNLVGKLPDYWDKLTSLQTLLDLSFNSLTGELPITLSTLSNIQHMFLTENLLSGNISDALLQDDKQFDFSYNNFTSDLSVDCKLLTPNLFASSSKRDASKIGLCLNKCPSQKIQSMNINCGGPAKVLKKVSYDRDENQGGASTFFSSSSYWVYVNTGIFISSGTVPSNPAPPYIQATIIPLLKQPDNYLYATARASPLSLTYYGYCLENGNYTVQLHFAEIIFTNDTTYKSLGRRVFDIYIQRKLVFKDFNIADEAGGVGIPYSISFNASVESNTLEIRLYWAGKGTDAIPEKGNYGPLISAITVYPVFPVSRRFPIWLIILIAVAAALIFVVSPTLIWCFLKKREDAVEEGENLFTLRLIKSATKNFTPANKIGEGGFGFVYKGVLPDGTPIAVKKLSTVSKQGIKEFMNELGVISALHHPHLVTLYGCCVEGSQLLLVYEYMDNNSLARALYGPKPYRLKLDWPTRLNICIGIARGLCYLHEESTLKIVHRDIKSTNVLLDKRLNPKISDFGLARLTDDDTTHVSTKIAGTFGYIAPEYAMRGQLSKKSDVYSFGVVLLEIVSGKSNNNFRPKEEDYCHLLDWALFLKQRGRLLELIDVRLGIECQQDEVLKVIDVALLCTSVSPAVRPAMPLVVTMLANVSPRSLENSCRVGSSVGDDVCSSIDVL